MLKRINKKKLGFTLIELLVVIAIIGILASIVLASLNTARVKARDARRLADIKQIQLALELYSDSSASGSNYPVASTVCSYPTTTYGLEAVDPSYISQIPRDPQGTGTGGCYTYASGLSASTPNAQYHLGVKLETTTNAAFNGDRDCNSSITTTGACWSNTVVNGFDGTNDGTNAIFDLVN